MKKNEIIKIILGGIAFAGGVIILAALPGLAGAFAPFIQNKRTLTRGQFKRSFDRLERNGLIGISIDGNKTVVKLTKAGENKVLKFKFDDMAIKKQKRWDRKWRIVIFDIPEAFKSGRNALTQKLRELGFAPIQKSVWVNPYPCEDEIDFIGELYSVNRYIRLVTAEKLDKKQDLERVFNLR